MLEIEPQALPPVNDLSELFSRDPLKLSDQDIDTIITTMRSMRTQWCQDEEAAIRTGKRVTSKAGKAPKANISVEQLKSLSLDDIL